MHENAKPDCDSEACQATDKGTPTRKSAVYPRRGGIENAQPPRAHGVEKVQNAERTTGPTVARKSHG